MNFLLRWLVIIPLMMLVGLMIVLAGAVVFSLQTLFRVGIETECLHFYSEGP